MYCQSVCYSELREKINKGGMWKQDAVKFKWVIFTVCGVVFGKYFSCRWTPLSEVYYMGISVSSEFSHIFVSWRLGLFIVCEYEFSPEPYTTSETTDLRRAMDATAVDCEWQANFWGSRGVFVCFFSPLHWNDLYKIVKKKISLHCHLSSPFEIHCLCRGILAVGCTRTCSPSKAELLCDARRTHFIAGIHKRPRFPTQARCLRCNNN